MQKFTSILKTNSKTKLNDLTTNDLNDENSFNKNYSNLFLKNKSSHLDYKRNIYKKNKLQENVINHKQHLTDTDNITNNKSFTNHCSNNASNNLNRFRTARKFLDKSKSSTNLRSLSSTSHVLRSQKSFINSSDEQLTSSETDDDEDEQEDHEDDCVYHTANIDESNENVFLKKSSFKANDSFILNKNLIKNKQDKKQALELNNYKPQKSKISTTKTSKTSRFKLIKSKSNSAIQAVKNSFKGTFDLGNNDNKQILNLKLKKNKKDEVTETNNLDQIVSQQQLGELFNRLQLIEQKLLENERKTEHKFKRIFSTKDLNEECMNSVLYKNNETIQSDEDDLYLKNKKFNQKRIYPSVSTNDCSQIQNDSKFKNKKTFSTSSKFDPKNSQYMSSVFAGTGSDEFNKLSNETFVKNSFNKTWKIPFNIISNLVDDKILKGNWSSFKNNKANLCSVRSNSICTALSPEMSNSTASNSTSSIKNKHQKIFSKNNSLINNNSSTNTDSDTNNRFNSVNKAYIKKKFNTNNNSLSDLVHSSNNESTNICNSKSNNSTNNNSAKSSCLSSTRNSNKTLFNHSNPSVNNYNQISQKKLLNKKTRAFSTPNAEIFNLLNWSFQDDDYHIDSKSPDLHTEFSNQTNKSFNQKACLKQSKSQKEIRPEALAEIEAFERLLSDKFSTSNFK